MAMKASRLSATQPGPGEIQPTVKLLVERVAVSESTRAAIDEKQNPFEYAIQQTRLVPGFIVAHGKADCIRRLNAVRFRANFLRHGVAVQTGRLRIKRRLGRQLKQQQRICRCPADHGPARRRQSLENRRHRRRHGAGEGHQSLVRSVHRKFHRYAIEQTRLGPGYIITSRLQTHLHSDALG